MPSDPETRDMIQGKTKALNPPPVDANPTARAWSDGKASPTTLTTTG